MGEEIAFVAGFFRDIQSFFDASYSGRYLSLILRELARSEPVSFARVVKAAASVDELARLARQIRIGAFEAECEYYFGGSDGRRRRADLALKRNGNPILLFEVKEFDGKSPGNPAQLQDYLALVRRDGVPFIYLTRFSPEPGDHGALESAGKQGHAVASLRYRDIYNALKKANGPIAGMVCSYLEDIGVASYQEIDLDMQQRSVAFALVKMLGFPHAHGLGRLASEQAVSELPAILRALFGNLEFLGDVVKEQNSGLIGTRFVRDLRPIPYFNLSKLGKALDKRNASKDEVDVLPGGSGQYIESGTVGFEAFGRIHSPPTAKQRLGPDDWLHVAVGYELDISVGKRDELASVYIFSGFRGRGFREGVWDYQKCANFPTEEQARRLLSKSLTRSLKEARENTAGSYKTALRHFRVPPPP